MSPLVVELGYISAPTESAKVVAGDGRRRALVCVVATSVFAGRLDD